LPRTVPIERERISAAPCAKHGEYGRIENNAFRTGFRPEERRSAGISFKGRGLGGEARRDALEMDEDARPLGTKRCVFW